MSELVGLYSKNYNLFLDALIKGLEFYSNYKISKFCSPPFYGALAQLKNLPFVDALENDNFLLLFVGELYNLPSSSTAEYILDLLHKRKNFSFLKDLEGIFSFSLFDKNSQVLYLVSDKFGLYPLYYTYSEKFLIFSSRIRPILLCSHFDKELDYQAIGDLFYFGFVTGNKTLFKTLKLLPPASVLSFSISEGRIKLEKYWEDLSLFSPKGESQEISPKEVAFFFHQAVKKRLREKDLLGLSLSGGLDSRSILAALGPEAQGMPSYTLGLPRCEDERLSARMARIAGTKHVFLPITENSLKNFLSLARTLVFFSDGFYYPHESTEKVALDYFKRAPFRILFRGHGGELAKAALAFPVQVDQTVLKAKKALELTKIFLQKTNLVLLDLAPEEVFLHPELKETVTRISEESFAKISNLLENLSPGDVFLYFYLSEYIRRQAVASLNIFRAEVEIRLPFLDEDFLKILFKLPVTKRYQGEIHFEIVKTYMPALIKVPNSNTGAPLDAGKWRLYFTDKFNSLLKKLSIPGFRHYTEFDRWHRKYFREALEDILFDQKTLGRGLFDSSMLQRIFESHVSGRKNYARFLGTAAGLELWFREYLD